MKKIFIIIICIFLMFLIIFFGIKVYFYTYENLANKRIAQVIELQGANNSEYEITFNSFNYTQGFWDEDIIFKNDKEIKYQYSFNRKDNIVKVFAIENKSHLPVTNEKTKYPLLEVKFNKKNEIINKRELDL